MTRRTCLRALLWIAPALVLGGYYVYRHVRESLLRSAVERAVAGAIGGDCRVRRAIIKAGRIYFTGLELRHPSGVTISCRNAVLAENGWPLDNRASGRLDALDVEVSADGLPPVRIDKVNLIRQADEKTGKPLLTFMAATKCAGFNAALEKKAGVRFEEGMLEVFSRPEIGGEGLDFPVLVRLINFKVRGLDGRFEVTADEARATVRVTGTRRSPRVDLGELEPYLGKGFTRGFGDVAP